VEPLFRKAPEAPLFSMIARLRIVGLGCASAIALWAITIAELFLVRAALGATTAPVRSTDFDTLTVLLVVAVGPLLEEFVFRFCMIGLLMKRLPTLISIPASTVAFAAWHAQYLSLNVVSLSALLSIVTGGLALGCIYVASRSLLAPLAAHIAYNAMTFAPTRLLYEVESLPAPAVLLFSCALITVGSWCLIAACRALSSSQSRHAVT
jgi:membrane protease YdiL (CAAX protease family)